MDGPPGWGAAHPARRPVPRGVEDGPPTGANAHPAAGEPRARRANSTGADAVPPVQGWSDFGEGQRAWFPRPFRPPELGGVPQTPGFTRGWVPAALRAA